MMNFEVYYFKAYKSRISVYFALRHDFKVPCNKLKWTQVINSSSTWSEREWFAVAVQVIYAFVDNQILTEAV